MGSRTGTSATHGTMSPGDSVNLSPKGSKPKGGPRQVVVPLDSTDHHLIQMLCRDGRISTTELAQRIGVSRSNAHARLSRLQATGVIEGFTARVNVRRMGLTVAAFIIVSVHQDHWRVALHKLQAMPEIAYGAFTAGEFDGILLVRAADMETIRDVVLERLHAMPEIRATRTVFILEELESSGEPLPSHLVRPDLSGAD